MLSMFAACIGSSNRNVNAKFVGQKLGVITTWDEPLPWNQSSSHIMLQTVTGPWIKFSVQLYSMYTKGWCIIYQLWVISCIRGELPMNAQTSLLGCSPRFFGCPAQESTNYLDWGLNHLKVIVPGNLGSIIMDRNTCPKPQWPHSL